ncbi:NAD(P)H-binding protein [Catenovulum maritimum]|uniref:NAD(P)-binding domain-containing protein n=1 Tax=Catenovulum maritimum TaxID=1513271 RepID=A0A0J8GU58_9ALTE|nr:NAD(P)H-binding protein [Catenovulum maritimum]KMT66295.1 hypothetical protein XM47_04705 [Catenovulum maritimum]
MRKVSLLGAGWLGLALATQLKREFYTVSVSKTSQLGVNNCKNMGLSTYLLDLDALNDDERVNDFFHCDILIVTIPPQFRQQKGHLYLTRWQKIIKIANLLGVKKLVMTSSTAVYPEHISVAYEGDASRHNDKAEILLDAEEHLRKEFKGDWLICRLGGLFNEERHPSRFIAKMKSVSKSAPANMLHQTDAVEAIQHLISFESKDSWNQIYNIVSPQRITKLDFYQAAANTKNMVFNNTISDLTGKQVKSDKLIAAGYSFVFNCAADAL